MPNRVFLLRAGWFSFGYGWSGLVWLCCDLRAFLILHLRGVEVVAGYLFPFLLGVFLSGSTSGNCANGKAFASKDAGNVDRGWIKVQGSICGRRVFLLLLFSFVGIARGKTFFAEGEWMGAPDCEFLL